MTHFVYRHLNISTFECFYIGIGSSKKFQRAHSINNRNAYWKNYVKKNGGFLVDIVANGISIDRAYEMEIELIRHYGKRINGGSLVNLSDGGDNGLCGIPRSKEHNERIGISQLGKIVSRETRAKQSAAKKGYKPSPETIEKIRIANTGRKASPESIAKYRISNSRKRRPQTSAHIEARRKSGAFSGTSKKVICINNNTVYNSAKEASLLLGISDKHIGSVCNGNRKHTCGFAFTYFKEN